MQCGAIGFVICPALSCRFEQSRCGVTVPPLPYFESTRDALIPVIPAVFGLIPVVFGLIPAVFGFIPVDSSCFWLADSSRFWLDSS